MTIALLVFVILIFLTSVIALFYIRKTSKDNAKFLSEMKKISASLAALNNPELNSAKNLVSRLAEFQNTKFAVGSRK